MRLLLFGGTTEGRRLALKLAEAGAEVTVCVASDYGREQQGQTEGLTVRVGPLREEEKLALLQACALCVDATHPYAEHVSASLRRACEKAGVELLRLKRAESELGGARLFPSAAEAAAWLAAREGRILLTTGARELEAFRALEPERLYPRILPSHESLSACEALGIPHRNIIAMQGPFTREMNAATLRQYDIRYLVTKDGGGPGGFAEKREAAREVGAELLCLQRPQESGLDYDAVYQRCIARLRAANTNSDKGEKT